MKIESTEKLMASIMYVIAFAFILATIFWFYHLGRGGIALGIGCALFFGQWGWNLWHKELDEQDHLMK
jgi:hypothetical protein